MKCIVTEINGAHAVLLSEKGDFLVAANRNYRIGQSVKYHSHSGLYKYAAMAACLILAVCLGVSGYKAYYTPVAYLCIGADRSIKLEINRFDRIIGADSSDDEWMGIFEEAGVKNKRAEQSVEKILNIAREHGYLTDTYSGLELEIISESGKLNSSLTKLADKYKQKETESDPSTEAPVKNTEPPKEKIQQNKENISEASTAQPDNRTGTVSQTAGNAFKYSERSLAAVGEGTVPRVNNEPEQKSAEDIRQEVGFINSDAAKAPAGSIWLPGNKPSEILKSEKPEDPEAEGEPERNEKPEEPEAEDEPERNEKEEASEKADEPEKDEQPAVYEKTDEPEKDEKPEVSENDDEPEKDEKPEVSENDDEPEEDEKPEVSENADEPEKDEKPEVSENADEPEKDEKPEVSENADEPEKDEQPEVYENKYEPEKHYEPPVYENKYEPKKDEKSEVYENKYEPEKHIKPEAHENNNKPENEQKEPDYSWDFEIKSESKEKNEINTQDRNPEKADEKERRTSEKEYGF
ncbi:MAG: hypothetical protein ACI4EA_02730 [Candidatus Ornithomonoglobus sp.]